MEKIMLSVLNMSFTASFVVLAVCLARILLKKAPKAMSYALWAVVAFRLLVPFSFESVFSLLPINPEPIPQDIVYQAEPRIDSGINIIDNAVSSYLPAATPTTASINPMQIILAVGSWLWLLGIAVMLIYSFVTIYLLKRRLRGSVLMKDNIYEADNIKTPFVLGFIKPKIYIPAALNIDEKGYIILHEQTHIKRNDHIIKLIAYFTLCLHWFNPFVWLAFVLMGTDMELSCDERVLKELGSGIKKDYSASLLSLSTGHRIINGSPLAFGEGGIKTRIKNVLNFKKSSRIIIIVAVALVAVFSIGFAVNKTVERPLIEMKMVYVENPAHWFKDMRLMWDDTTYYVTNIANAKRGNEIAYATDEASTWRVYELKGYGRDYLYAVESEDVWRVMSIYPPEEPLRQYVLEGATDKERFERLLSVTLYEDDTARLATAPISSYAIFDPVYYSFENGELLIGYKNNNLIESTRFEPFAIFDVVDDNTIVFKSATVPLYAEVGARYFATNSIDINNQEVKDALIDAALPEAQSIEAIRDLDIKELISKDTAYLTQTMDQNFCEVVFPVNGYEYSISVAFTRQNENSEWTLFPVNAVNVYDPGRWDHSPLQQMYLGMTRSEVEQALGQRSWEGSGLDFWVYDDLGSVYFDGDFYRDSDTYRGADAIVTRINMPDRVWDISELVSTAVIQHNMSGSSVGIDTESHVPLLLNADVNGFTIYVVSLYESFVPDGEYNVKIDGSAHMPLVLSFSKTENGDYELTELWQPKDGSEYLPSIQSKFPREIWDRVDTQLYIEQQSEACYEDAMYIHVGEVPRTNRYSIDLGMITLTNVAYDVVENECFMVKYFPEARLQITVDDGELTPDKPGYWIVEYSDPSKNITISMDGIRDLPITEDLIGVYNTESGRYAMQFELYKKAD